MQRAPLMTFEVMLCVLNLEVGSLWKQIQVKGSHDFLCYVLAPARPPPSLFS